MIVSLKPAGDGIKKWKVDIEQDNGKTCTVKFGQYGASDFTIHKNVLRMYKYVRRHHAINLPKLKSTESYTKEELKKLMYKMDSVDTSRKEKWGIDGVCTAGFWSRWLTWSRPDIEDAKTLISKKCGITFKGSRKKNISDADKEEVRKTLFKDLRKSPRKSSRKSPRKSSRKSSRKS
jgi:hypothetical protein